MDVVAGRLHDVTLYQLLGWATSLVVAVLTMVCLVCKVYSRLTVGTCTSNKDMTGRTVLITGANAGTSLHHGAGAAGSLRWRWL